MKDRYSYIALMTSTGDGIAIEFPDLPGCYSVAENNNLEDALHNAKEAMGLHLWGLEQDNEAIPKASSINDIKPRQGQIIVLVEVFMPPVRERINNRFVKKTLSLPSWLANAADENGVNCSKIFQNALIEYLNLNQKADSMRSSGAR